MLVAKEPAEDCIRVDAFRGQKRGDVIAERLRIIELGRVSGYWLMMRQENVLLSVALFEDFDQPVPLPSDRIARISGFEPSVVISSVEADESPAFVFKAKKRLGLSESLQDQIKVGFSSAIHLMVAVQSEARSRWYPDSGMLDVGLERP